MKKRLAVLLLLFCVALPACTGRSTDPASSDAADTTTEAATVTETAAETMDGADTAEATTEADTEIGTDAVTELTTEPATEANTEAETEADTEADTAPAESEKPVNEIYYVRTPAQPPERTAITYPVYEFASYDHAVRKASDERMAAKGYAVYNENGEFVYGLHNEYVTYMMYTAKYIVDFARENDYVYGSAAQNPGWTFFSYLKRGRLTEKVVSCDRFVGWVLYEMGYTDQPKNAGMFVWANASSSEHNLMIFLEKHNYERIDRTTDFKAGDIVFVRPTTSSGGSPYGAHVFICAGNAGQNGQFYRYDHGSDTRIQSVQPSREGISELFCVYRPTQTTLEDLPSGNPSEP